MFLEIMFETKGVHIIILTKYHLSRQYVICMMNTQVMSHHLLGCSDISADSNIVLFNFPRFVWFFSRTFSVFHVHFLFIAYILFITYIFCYCLSRTFSVYHVYFLLLFIACIFCLSSTFSVDHVHFLFITYILKYLLNFLEMAWKLQLTEYRHLRMPTSLLMVFLNVCLESLTS